MKNYPFIQLLIKYRNGTISRAEYQQLQEYLEQDALDLMDALEELSAPETDRLPKIPSEKMFNNIAKQLPAPSKRNYVRQLGRIATVAAVLLLVCFVVFYNTRPEVSLDHSNNLQASDFSHIHPGSSKGRVILEDGRTIDLQSLPNDTLIQLGSYSIVKRSGEGIRYLINPGSEHLKGLRNTIVVPKGGQYDLVLADGTEISVNANSRLSYPLDFGKHSREVELKGEAHFAVKKVSRGDQLLPFIVHSQSQRLEVMGTTFNVNTHSKNIETTLLEGKVRLSFAGKHPHILKPNQQARYSMEEDQVAVSDIDPFYAVAWKDGNFAFDDATLEDVLASIGRWYDVEFIFAPGIRNFRFTGTISRSDTIENMLKTIELTNAVKFKRQQGRRIMVTR